MAPEMDVLSIQRMTMADFEVLSRAYELRQIDAMFMASFQAWQTSQAQSTDKKGHPIHRKFKSLFDYEDSVKRVQGGYSTDKTIMDKTGTALAARANQREVSRRHE